MTWFKIDDGSAFNAKVLAAGNEAWGAFCRVGAWCSQQLTDGAFTDEVAASIASPKVWSRLALAKLIERADAGWQIHNFLKRNPSKEAVLAERERKQDAGRKGGTVKAQRVAASLAPASRVLPESALPPSRPVPIPIQKETTHTQRAGAREGFDGDTAAVVAAIAAEPKFSSIDAVDMALRTMPVGNRKPLEHVLRAISDAAADTPAGETVQAIQKRLRVYIANARAPIAPPVSGVTRSARDGVPVQRDHGEGPSWKDELPEDVRKALGS